MASYNFENLITNQEILNHLYKQLNFEHQLRLSRVCVRLKTFFETHIWRESYRVLHINYNANRSDFVISNGTGVNRLCLNQHELEQFIGLYALQVQELVQNRTKLFDLRQFHNLRSLTYLDMNIDYKHLQALAEYCPNLEKLHLSCLTADEGDFIEIGKNWSIKRVLKLKKLKCLRLDNENYVPLKYRHFRQLVTKRHMENLQLKAAIIPDERIIKADNKFKTAIPLQHLNIAASFERHKWSGNFLWFLSNFENLLNLTIKITHTINEETLTTIATTCKHLEKLHIQYSSFGSVKLWNLPPKLNDLALEHCRGLSFEVLKEILNKSQLKRFSNRDSDVEAMGDQLLPISSSLQSLDVEGVGFDHFQWYGAAANTNLTALTWYHPIFTKDQRDINSGLCLIQCPNLETLNIREGHIAVTALLKLKSLRQMKMPHPRPLLGWSYFTSLLKHTSLSELTIRDACSARGSKLCADVPVQGFPTNVHRLQVPLDMLDEALDFWLDLFGQNRNMTLICSKFSPHDMPFLKKLINHPNFPRTLKTIDICCFAINCDDLRRHFDATVEKLQQITINYYGYEYDDEVFRIILCRK